MKQKVKLIPINEFKKNLLSNPRVQDAYNALETEYQIADQMIAARTKKKMSQEDLAERVGTGQAVISRLEGMNAKPSISLLKRVAKALDIQMNLTIQ